MTSSLDSMILHTTQGDITLKPVDVQKEFIPPDQRLRVDFSKGNFFRCRHDFELERNGYREKPLKYGTPRQKQPGFEQPNKSGMPETVMMFGRDPSTGRVYDFTHFSKEWQERAKELLDWAIDHRLEEGVPFAYYKRINGKVYPTSADDPFARVKYKPYLSDAQNDYIPFSSLGIWEDSYSDSVALTDNHAFDDGLADWVQMRNLDKALMQHKALLMGGLPVNVLGTNGKYKIIETLDPLQPPPPLEWILEHKPYLIGWGVAADVVKLPDGRWVCSMWGKFKAACKELGIPNVGFPYFIFGRGGTNLVLTENLIKMTNEEYTPYVP
jgi:hypothetical protein